MTCGTGENVIKSNGHGGDIYRNQVTYDFSINVNPLGMPEQVKQILKASVESWSAYPDPECQELVAAIARYHHISPEWILCGNGAADLIYRLVWAVKPRRALLAVPTFSEYERALRETGCRVDIFEMKEEEDFRLDMGKFAGLVVSGTDMVFLCNPNNPNGLPVPKRDVLALADACRRVHATLVVDECFCELLEEPGACSVIPEAEERPGIVILRAFTKTYAMAGLRLGYAVCSDRLLLEQMRRFCQPWNISVPAQQAGTAALGEKEYLARARLLISTERERMEKRLREMGLKVYPSAANFLLFWYPDERENSLWKWCAKQGVLIRDCSNYRGLGKGYYRVCIRKPQENEQLLRIVKEAAGQRSSVSSLA